MSKDLKNNSKVFSSILSFERKKNLTKIGITLIRRV